MRLTCQEHLVPGNTLLEKWRFLERAGWDGLELLGAGAGAFRGRAGELREARDADVPMRTGCVQGGPFIGGVDPPPRAPAGAPRKGPPSGLPRAGGARG